MNVTHFNNNGSPCSSKKKLWSKETTDLLFKLVIAVACQDKGVLIEHNTRRRKKGVRFNVQNTKLISGWLVCWGVKLRYFPPARRGIPRSSRDEIPHQLCSGGSGEPVPTYPGKERAPLSSSSSGPLAAHTSLLCSPKLSCFHF